MRSFGVQGTPFRARLRGVAILLALSALSIAAALAYLAWELDLLGRDRRASLAARTFSAGRSELECVRRALLDTEACAGQETVEELLCARFAERFLQRCAALATPVPELCASYPPCAGITEGQLWAIGICGGLGHRGSVACARLVTLLEPRCARERPCVRRAP